MLKRPWDKNRLEKRSIKKTPEERPGVYMLKNYLLQIYTVIIHDILILAYFLANVKHYFQKNKILLNALFYKLFRSCTLKDLT